jgi:hypothetical protein
MKMSPPYNQSLNSQATDNSDLDILPGGKIIKDGKNGRPGPAAVAQGNERVNIREIKELDRWLMNGAGADLG